jgi:hypothetical protein
VKKNGKSKRRNEEWQLGIKLVTALLEPPAGSWLLAIKLSCCAVSCLNCFWYFGS